MGPVLALLAIVVIVLLIVPFVIYNRFVRLRNFATEAWHDIETELQRRYDLVPNLVAAVKGYAAHERQVLEALTAARADAMAARRPPDEQGTRERALDHTLVPVLALAEQYPDLKASENFLALQSQLTDTEDRIQVSRRIYNANVRSFNTLVATFPSTVVAKACRFSAMPFFELSTPSAAAPPPFDLSSGQ